MDNASNKDRHDGFVSFLKKKGHAASKIEIGENSVDFGRRATRAIFSNPKASTALFASTYLITEGVLMGLKDLNLRQGIDVEVLGFDVQYAHLLEPPLMVFVQPAFEIGVEAVRSILAVIRTGVERDVDPLPVSLQPAMS